ncbi:DUF6338 family protein [Kribbella sp. NBC_01484]|uniref:DUF6338 family protein n=1 Tax=Kribbella sp. NBC_01484 TaxID=2903579 RepID=UPI002E37AD06|nr:DUF6338 family protein [Kribbella sp. NBC_01484]
MTLVLFLLLVAPGLLFDLLASSRRVGASESAFREISRVALGSLGFSIIGLAAVTVLHLRWGRAFVALDRAVTDKQYLTSQLRHVVVTALVATGIAMLAAWVLDLILKSPHDTPNLTSRSLWVQTFRKDQPEGTYTALWVKLTSGPRFIGQVRGYTADSEVADREIILVPPLYMELPGHPELIPLADRGWQRVVIPSHAIEMIGVRYPRKPAKNASAPAPDPDPDPGS